MKRMIILLTLFVYCGPTRLVVLMSGTPIGMIILFVLYGVDTVRKTVVRNRGRWRRLTIVLLMALTRGNLMRNHRLILMYHKEGPRRTSIVRLLKFPQLKSSFIILVFGVIIIVQ